MKKVLITGGNKGIGLETTRLFIKRNYNVIIVARDFNDFEFQNHHRVKTIKFDLTEIAKIPALITSIGHVDVLINNSGLMLSLPYDEYPDEKRDYLMNLNLYAPIVLMQEVSKSMIQKGGGRIVNNASIASHIGHPDIWYGISKAGLLNATKSFAKLLGSKGIVVNAVAAGPVETAMLNIIPESRKTMVKNAVYLGRFAYPLEVAKAMVWLAIDSPEYINGTCIDINNGSFPR